MSQVFGRFFTKPLLILAAILSLGLSNAHADALSTAKKAQKKADAAEVSTDRNKKTPAKFEAKDFAGVF